MRSWVTAGFFPSPRPDGLKTTWHPCTTPQNRARWLVLHTHRWLKQTHAMWADLRCNSEGKIGMCSEGQWVSAGLEKLTINISHQIAWDTELLPGLSNPPRPVGLKTTWHPCKTPQNRAWRLVLRIHLHKLYFVWCWEGMRGEGNRNGRSRKDC